MSFNFSQHTALVTGGAGFIGSNLAEKLLQAGAKVRIIDNFSTGKKINLESIASRVEVVEGDIRNRDTVRKALAGVNVIFHIAALPSVPRSMKEPYPSCDINIMGSLSLFEEARLAGIKRIVFSSSSSVYGETAELPKAEHFTPSPLSPYAVGKLATEYLASVFSKSYGMDIVCLRYFNVFGPRQDPESDYAAVIPRFIKLMLEKKSPVIYGDGQQTRDFTFVDDVVSANMLAAQAKNVAGAVINIAGGTPKSVNELCGILAKIAGVNVTPKYEPARPGDILHSYAEVTRAKTLLGWTPNFSLEAGLRKTHEWFVGPSISRRLSPSQSAPCS